MMSTATSNPYEPSREPVEAAIVAGGTGLVRDGETLSVGYDIGVEDLVAFSMYHNAHSPGQKRFVYLVWLIAGVLAAIGLLNGVLMLANQRWELLPMVLFCTAFAMFFSVFYPVLRRWSLRRAIRRLYSEGRNTSMCGGWRLIVSRARLTVFMPLIESHYHWQAVERIVRAPDALYVYVSSVSALVIPRRAFADARELEEMEQVIRTRSGLALA